MKHSRILKIEGEFDGEGGLGAQQKAEFLFIWVYLWGNKNVTD